MTFTGLIAGCSTTRRNTQSPRTTVEQLLISEAVIRSLPRQPESALPIPEGSNVILNTPGLPTGQTLLLQVLTGWLGATGIPYRKTKKMQRIGFNVMWERWAPG